MPAFETIDRYQPIVLWQATGAFDNFAVPIVSAPVQIRGQWTDQQQQVLGPDGQTMTLDGTAVIHQFIRIGSHLWLGLLADWYGIGSSGDDNNVREVKMYSQVSDLKNRNVAYKVGFLRWKNKV